MVRRTRADTEETRATLLATARKVFTECGYAATSMDELTAQAGLTRGALYHHFGDKKGLLAAVVEQIDAETDARLRAISESAQGPWEGFNSRCRAYLEMALEPDIQRIVLRDARAVLGGPSPDSRRHCLNTMQRQIETLMQQGVLVKTDPEALTSLLYGSLAEAAVWIAQAEHGAARMKQAHVAFQLLLQGLLKHA
ncbi:MAG: TetR/AcrR family transcriptional regulator [Advenella sp.]